MIELPAMPPEQTASWLGLLDLHERLAGGWTLIGGQLVHLHCAERGQFPVRPTNDADARLVGVLRPSGVSAGRRVRLARLCREPSLRSISMRPTT